LNCGKPFSEDLEFVGRRKKYTHRYAKKITSQVIHSDVHNIATNNDLTDEEVWSMVKHSASLLMSVVFNNFKGSKYVFLKSEQDLSEKQRSKLAQVKEASPLIQRMHELKEDFSQIFDASQTLGDGTLKLLDWLKDAQGFFPKSVLTIQRWFGEIVGYLEQHTNNGLVEGINNKLKLLKRSAFNFRNFDNFQLRALLYWHFPSS
jgi:transposase